METTTKRAVIFARVSTKEQKVERQIADLTSYAKGNGYNVVKSFSEKISGAKKNNERPILRECLEFCFDNNIHTLLLSELSRLGRDSWEIMENIKECKDKQLNVYFQKESLSIFDTNGNETKLLGVYVTVLGMVAETERENILYRTNSGIAKAKADGVVFGRKVGYRKPKEQKEEQYKSVLSALKRGDSIRNIACRCEVGISTVKRLKKEFNL